MTEVQKRIQMRVTEIDIEVFEELFAYWATRGSNGKTGNPGKGR